MRRIVVSMFVVALAAILFLAGCAKNELPIIEIFEVDPASDTLIVAGDTIQIKVQASDPDGDSVKVNLEVDAGTLVGSQDGSEIFWISPDYSGTFNVNLTVTDRDTIIDTTDCVTDAIQVHVQNYFPMERGYSLYYDGFIWLITNIPKSITRNIYSKEDRGDGEFLWHIETKDSTAENINMDSLDYFSVKEGSVFESVRIYSRALPPNEGEICEMPLWEGKKWAYNEDGFAEVIEIRSRGTSAFSFDSCAHIEITFPGDSALVRTIWFAPDVGIIEDKLESKGSELFDFELLQYEFD
ncbi:hypothetical protein JXM67_03410 [candidate division WOR-3 bacterium]|nr:hypothetical protein [candidate division WOR-3 bacterium]